MDWTMDIVKHYSELVPETAKEVFVEGFSKALGIEESSLTVDDPRVETAMNTLLDGKVDFCYSEIEEGVAKYNDTLYISIDSIKSFEDFVEKANDLFEYEYDPIEAAREEYEQEQNNTDYIGDDDDAR